MEFVKQRHELAPRTSVTSQTSHTGSHKTVLDFGYEITSRLSYLWVALAGRPPLQVLAPRRRTNLQANRSRYDKVKHVRLQTLHAYGDDTKAERDSSSCCPRDGMERWS